MNFCVIISREVCHKEFDDLKEQKLFLSHVTNYEPIKRGTRTDASIQGYFPGLLRTNSMVLS